MKNIEQYYLDEIDVMRGYIITYINEKFEKLDQLDGFNLGQIYSFFSNYVYLLKEKRISGLNETNEKKLKVYQNVLDCFPDLIKFIQNRYDKDLNDMITKNPDGYFNYMKDLMNSRGFSIN